MVDLILVGVPVRIRCVIFEDSKWETFLRGGVARRAVEKLTPFERKSTYELIQTSFENGSSASFSFLQWNLLILPVSSSDFTVDKQRTSIFGTKSPRNKSSRRLMGNGRSNKVETGFERVTLVASIFCNRIFCYCQYHHFCWLIWMLIWSILMITTGSIPYIYRCTQHSLAKNPWKSTREWCRLCFKVSPSIGEVLSTSLSTTVGVELAGSGWISLSLEPSESIGNAPERLETHQ